MTKAELVKRVAELEAELAQHRGHVCPVPICVCGSAVTAGVLPCPVHSALRWQPQWQTMCAAAAGCAPPTTYFTIETGAVDQFFGTGLNPAANACAGGLAGQSYWVTIPA